MARQRQGVQVSNEFSSRATNCLNCNGSGPVPFAQTLYEVQYPILGGIKSDKRDVSATLDEAGGKEKAEATMPPTALWLIVHRRTIIIHDMFAFG